MFVAAPAAATAAGAIRGCFVAIALASRAGRLANRTEGHTGGWALECLHLPSRSVGCRQSGRAGVDRFPLRPRKVGYIAVYQLSEVDELPVIVVGLKTKVQQSMLVAVACTKEICYHSLLPTGIYHNMYQAVDSVK